MVSTPCIAILATGEELTQGDILNTNGQYIARQLADRGFNIGTHVIVGDVEQDMMAGIQFLLAKHTVLIITGGLGPTSDDRTRYALSTAINKPLQLDAATWNNIIERATRLGFEPHISNQQQALFPLGADIIPNPNGTAAGCKVSHENKFIYMLPGPPRECLPMFDAAVLPDLLQLKIQSDHIYKKWRLFSVNESEIAAQLDNLVAPYAAVTGYRWDYPYLEFKLHLPAAVDLSTLMPLLETALAPHIICDAEYTAAQLLKNTLANYQGNIVIQDHATGAFLESVLLTPETKHCLKFLNTTEQNQDENSLLVKIEGLNEFWQAKPPVGETVLEIQFISKNKEEAIKQIIPYRSNAVRQYAVEYSCYQILKHLSC